jgi:hypothetical protein
MKLSVGKAQRMSCIGRRTEVYQLEVDGVIPLLFADGCEVLIAPAGHVVQELIARIRADDFLVHLGVERCGGWEMRGGSGKIGTGEKQSRSGRNDGRGQ